MLKLATVLERCYPVKRKCGYNMATFRPIPTRWVKYFVASVAVIIVATALAAIQPPAADAARAPDLVTVVPAEHNNLMTAPGIGFQDFVGTVPTATELANCSYDTTVDTSGLKGGSLYVRLLWRDLEPVEDQYAWPMLDRLFECVEQRNQTIDFRVMTSWPGAGDYDCLTDPSENDALDHGIPCWLVRKGVSELEHDGIGGTEATYVPDWEDATIRADHAELINALGARYANNPRLNSVDIGSVGFWGEWHTYPNDAQLMPSKARAKEIIDLHASAFPDTPLVALAQIFKDERGGDAEIANYLETNYAGRYGWRGDSWGQAGHHTFDYEPIHAAHPDLWKTGPVAMEVTGIMSWWPPRMGIGGYTEVLPVATSVNDALAWHSSIAHNKAATIPAGYIDAADPNEPDLRSMARSLGARFVLDRLTYTDEVTAGDPTQITSVWHNRGVAPLYRDFRISYRLRNASGEMVIRTGTTMEGVLPTGATPVSRTTTVNIPASVAAGDYTLDVAIAYVGDIDLKMPIAITNSSDNDWYEIGPIAVVGGSQISGITASADVNGQNAANIVDGDPDTSWNNGGVPANGTFSLDLGASTDVTRIRYQDDFSRKLRITLDGVEVFNDWTSAAGEDVFAEIVLDPAVTGRVLQFELLSGDWLVPDEVEVYGAAGGPGFSCASDGGVVSWTDAAVGKYWVYRSTDGGVSFSWLGRTIGSPAATTFTDAGAAVGVKYQVHYQGIPRVECSITSEPSDGGPGFSCASDGGVVSWTDAAVGKYWVYRSTDGGASFSWLGRTIGSPAPTTFTDANAAMGAIYQVHYAGIPRIECAT